MKRSHRRWLALVKAQVARAWTTGKRALLTDTDVTVDTAASQRAEAESFAGEAEQMRGGMAKLAQLRGYLDALAPDARARLGALWDRMPGEQAASIRRVIVAELGAEPEALFARWDDHPLAAASLSQVHAAEDHSGRALAVKVQYPEVADSLRDDLAAPGLLRRMVGADLGATIDDAALERLRTHLLAELDYRIEAGHLRRFGATFAGDACIVVPALHADRSSARVLTMDRLVGRTLSEHARDDPPEAHARVAGTLLRFALGAPLQHGFFNADPHPGNYLVLDASLGRVGFVDFGCVVELSEETRAADRRLWRALITRDGEELRHAAHQQGLVSDANVYYGPIWRDWERLFGLPFLTQGPFALTPSHVREWIACTRELMRVGRLSLPASALMLWRQRLGVFAVAAELRPTLDFRRLLAQLLDDGHPVPLLDRYR